MIDCCHRGVALARISRTLRSGAVGVDLMADELVEKTATPELSKRVLDDRKDGDRFTAAAKEHAPRVAKAIGDALGAKQATAVNGLVAALAEHVTKQSEAMVAADVAYTIELSDDAAPRNERDRQEKLTREAITEVRERVTGLYGGERRP